MYRQQLARRAVHGGQRVIVVVATPNDVDDVRARVGELGVRAIRVLSPTDHRRLVLAVVDDESHAHQLAATLRDEGRIAVGSTGRRCPPAGMDAPHQSDRVRGTPQRVLRVVGARSHCNGRHGRARSGWFRKWRAPDDADADRAVVTPDHGWGTSARRRLWQRRARSVRATARGIVRRRGRQPGRLRRGHAAQCRAQRDGRSDASDARATRRARRLLRRHPRQHRTGGDGRARTRARPTVVA